MNENRSLEAENARLREQLEILKSDKKRLLKEVASLRDEIEDHQDGEYLMVDENIEQSEEINRLYAEVDRLTDELAEAKEALKARRR